MWVHPNCLFWGINSFLWMVVGSSVEATHSPTRFMVIFFLIWQGAVWINMYNNINVGWGICCNGVKLSPCKRSMIHANAP